MTKRLVVPFLAALAMACVAVAQPTDGSFQVRYAANLVPGLDSVVNFTNTGANNGADICVNTYTYAPDEQLVSCCACRVTRNGLWSMSAKRDLTSNSLTPVVEQSIVIKLLATTAPANGVCNPASPGSTVQGLAAWGTTTHLSQGTTGIPYSVETPFTNSTLSTGEQAAMTGFCGFILANGSGHGVCRACEAFRVGFPTPTVTFGPNNPAYNVGLGGDKQ